MKKCAKCNIEHHDSKFYKKPNGKLRPYCRECNKIYARERYLKNKDSINVKYRAYHKANPHINRASRYRRTYNISMEEYNRIFESQDGRCAICDRHQSNF